jgi:hypothetical protein
LNIECREWHSHSLSHFLVLYLARLTSTTGLYRAGGGRLIVTLIVEGWSCQVDRTRLIVLEMRTALRVFRCGPRLSDRSRQSSWSGRAHQTVGLVLGSGVGRDPRRQSLTLSLSDIRFCGPLISLSKAVGMICMSTPPSRVTSLLLAKNDLFRRGAESCVRTGVGLYSRFHNLRVINTCRNMYRVYENPA